MVVYFLLSNTQTSPNLSSFGGMVLSMTQNADLLGLSKKGFYQDQV
jgi:hypothetical protein